MRSSGVLVTGARGLIGHHLPTYLKDRGFLVRGVDLKAPGFEMTAADEFEVLDLRRHEDCPQASQGVDDILAPAADMGFISADHARIFSNNGLINLQTIEAARLDGVVFERQVVQAAGAEDSLERIRT